MSAHTPIKAAPSDLSDNCCDQCCAGPVIAVLDGDKLCQSCADKWCQGEADYYGHAPDEDEIAHLRRVLRTAGPDRAVLIEARLSDASVRSLVGGMGE